MTLPRLNVRYLALVGLFASVGVQWARSTQFKRIDVPDSSNTMGLAINNSRQMVGTFTGSDFIRHGFQLAEGQFTSLDIPNAGETIPRDINALSQVVGFAQDAGFNSGHGFLIDGDAITLFDFPGAMITAANGINGQGLIVGSYCVFCGNPTEHGFVYDGQTFTSIDFPGSVDGTALNGVNDLGQMVGAYSGHGFLLDTDGTFSTIDFPGAASTEANAIDNAGDVVGTYYTGSGEARTAHGFLLSNGSFTTMEFPGAINTYVFGINDRSHLVGYASDGYQNFGFVADRIFEAVPSQTAARKSR